MGIHSDVAKHDQPKKNKMKNNKCVGLFQAHYSRMQESGT